MAESSPINAAVLTVSDSSFRGERKDVSGRCVADALRKRGYSIVKQELVADEQPTIQDTLANLAMLADLVVTTGGTGIAPRDVTPEATRAVCSRLIEGVAERMRAEGAKKTPYAVLSRGVCGVRERSVILNLPGSPAGALESLESVIDILPHIIQLLAGNTKHE